MTKPNVLYNEDCLDILKEFPTNSIHLIYADPPYWTNKKFTNFNDLWKLDKAAEERLILLQAWEHWQPIMDLVASEKTLLSYISYITQRLLEIHRILKETGSFYLHCDPRISHYLKIVLDKIFGLENYLNENIWYYQTGGAGKKSFSRKHDIIFLYLKNKHSDYIFNMQKEKVYEYRKGYKNVTSYVEPGGKTYRLANARDVWIDIPALGRTSGERLGYSTQKPIQLLKKIIVSSSNKGDIVLDPFCGSGTALVAAQQLDRKWIGIDINKEAIELCSQRLKAEQLFLV